jgi:hypothetical protein
MTNDLSFNFAFHDKVYEATSNVPYFSIDNAHHNIFIAPSDV